MSRSVYEAQVDEQRQIERQLSRSADKIVGRKFGAVAKVLWPFKTAAEIAAIAGTNQRTAERWMAGEFEPPIIVLLAVINKMFERQA